jgi:hypothetical protein
MLPDELRQAANLIRTGKSAEARPILARYVQQHPESEQGWLLLSMVLSERSQRIDCLERVLKINPGNSLARERLAQFQSGSRVAPAAPAASRAVTSTGQKPEARKKPTPAAARPATGTPAPPKPVGPAVAAGAQPGPAAQPRKTPVPPKAAAGAPKPKKRGSGVWIALLVVLAVVALAGIGYVGLSFLRTLQPSAVAPGGGTPLGEQSLPPSWTPTLTATATPVPSLTPTPTLTTTPTLVPPDPTTDALMQRIEAEVSDIRGLEAEEPVARYVVSRSAVRPILETAFLANGGSQAEMDDEARVQSALGLIKPTYDMYTNALNGLTDSVGGFFFPWSDEVYVIGNRFGGVEHFIYSHEYAHALVDQTYHVDAQGVYPQCLSNSDRCRAIKALVEGDATLVMGLWWRQYASPTDYQDIQNYAPPQTTLPEQYPPQYTLLDGQFPYVQGLGFVNSLHDAGNWPEVNKAYARWPESTEQILHPEKYRAGEKPQEISAPALGQVLGEGWRKLTEDTLGEWTTYLLLGYGADVDAMLEASVAAAAARGWGGDRYQVYYQDETERTVLAAVWGWDTAQDASQFLQAMTDHLGKRFREAEVVAPEGTCWQVNQQTTCLYAAGRQVLWLLAPDMGTLNLVRAAYPSF